MSDTSAQGETHFVNLADGTYQVELVVEDATGGQTTASAVVTVEAPGSDNSQNGAGTANSP